MTLEEARRVEAAATPVARALIVLIIATNIAIPIGVHFAQLPPVRLAMTIGAPLLLVAYLILAWRLRRASPHCPQGSAHRSPTDAPWPSAHW